MDDPSWDTHFPYTWNTTSNYYNIIIIIIFVLFKTGPVYLEEAQLVFQWSNKVLKFEI